MNLVKREKWTESEIDALPAGEHDYFERKSGRLFEKSDDALGTIAKALSALANSGGGHLILGVDNAGVPDGVPSAIGRTGVREWLEQKIPHLVEYPLADFRVHVAECAKPSRVPAGREVIVIDVGDSALAPHQCNYGGGEARKRVYYYRQAGRSEPAPHFYLELLRQRLVSPVIEARLVRVVPEKVTRIEGGVCLAMRLRFLVENTGRVAAYKWHLQIREMEGHNGERVNDYYFRLEDFPAGTISHNVGIRIDDTLLSGGVMDEVRPFGVMLRPSANELATIQLEMESVLGNLVLCYRVATETSPGEIRKVRVTEVVKIEELSDFLMKGLQKA